MKRTTDIKGLASLLMSYENDTLRKEFDAKNNNDYEMLKEVYKLKDAISVVLESLENDM